MDNSYSSNDVSLSPSQILERLQVLRQLQLLQRSKLQRQQQLQYDDSQEESNTASEFVSQFTSSTSYNTFQSLLQDDGFQEVTPNRTVSGSGKVSEQDLIEGVSILNLSQESEFVINSPVSTNSQVSAQLGVSCSRESQSFKNSQNKKISLDEMPVLSSKIDFEALVVDKMQSEQNGLVKSQINPEVVKSQPKVKKPFLKKGACLARFGLEKKNLVIQNTKSLPWKRKAVIRDQKPVTKSLENSQGKRGKKNQVQFTEPAQKVKNNKVLSNVETTRHQKITEKPKIISEVNNTGNINMSMSTEMTIRDNSGDKLQTNKSTLKTRATGKTWAAILTKEQDDFLRQLKQSDYYKNFESPTKSIVSDTSCDENSNRMKLEREIAEQNMFNLLENKVSHESFNLESSFFHKFLKNQLECSGESTPIVLQRCLKENPKLLHIQSSLQSSTSQTEACNNVDTCDSEYTDCDETSSCCSCNTIEQQCDCETSVQKNTGQKQDKNVTLQNTEEKVTSQDDNVTNNDLKETIDMNARLIATNDLLKERVKELDDEIEIFRRENANLIKMREEVDLERKKFYEEKAALEQKFNEEKILSEYYMSEEKEKLMKQKQTYERYVREMRGRLNKKEKDETINLKKDIRDLKEEIRLKDAKSTTSIARLRNQLKIVEREKKELEDECEKLKKEIKRIQHVNDTTRRLSNIKYLEEINRKLSSITKVQSNINVDKDIKYKAYEIERQSRVRKKELPMNRSNIRQRAKSVPNINVTSRYAKYFSQRDSVSDMDRNKSIDLEHLGKYSRASDDDDNQPIDLENDCYGHSPQSSKSNDSLQSEQNSNHSDDEENKLERIYMERFMSTSPQSVKITSDNTDDISPGVTRKSNDFFLRKSDPIINTNSEQSISNITKSSVPSTSTKGSRSKSPTSILNHRSESIEHTSDRIVKTAKSSPELTTKISVTKTNLNPTEIKRPDGLRELRYPNGNVKYISADGTYSKFVYYNGDIKETFYDDGRIKYFYADTKTYHTTYADGLEVLEFPDGQVEKHYKDGSTEIRLPNGSIRYTDPKNEHVREEWRFPDGTVLTVASSGEQRVRFANGQVEVHAKDHKRREFPDGTVKLVYTDGTSETRYASGRIRIKNRLGNLIMDSSPA